MGYSKQLTYSLNVLWNEYKRRLSVAGAAKRTIVTEKTRVNRVQDYMTSVGATEYTPSLGEGFLSANALGGGRDRCKNLAKTIRRLDSCLAGRFWVEEYNVSKHSIQLESIGMMYDFFINEHKVIRAKRRALKCTLTCLLRIDIYLTEFAIPCYTKEAGASFLRMMSDVSTMDNGAFSMAYRIPVSRINACLESRIIPEKLPHGYSVTNDGIREALGRMEAQLVEEGYAASSISQTRSYICQLDYYICSRGIEKYSPEIGAEFLEWHGIRGRHTDELREPYIASVVRHFDKVFSGERFSKCPSAKAGIIPAEYADALDVYLGDCVESGNSPFTIKTKRNTMSRFFNALTKVGTPPVESLVGTDILEAARHLNPADYRTIRGFLRSCAQHGLVGRDYSYMLPSLRQESVIPPYYTKDERRRLESAPDRSTPIGKRDYAIILIVDRLGLRSSDVVRLTLSSIHDDKIVFDQYKTGAHQELPIVGGIGEAINEYVRLARPETSSDCLFITAHAPYVHLSTSTIHSIFTKYLQTAGIDTSGRKHGGHAFRASLLTSMVNDGITYDEARYVAGHRGDESIRNYASLDINSLRTCALDPEPSSGMFAHLLSEGGVVNG